MASTDCNVATSRGAEDTTEDLASASSLWPPRMVVKRHRKTATTIWISLLVSFFVYVGYVMWDTVDARRSPASSIELKQRPYMFPDVAICESFLHGCLSETEYCFDGWEFSLLSQSGFTDDPDYFVPADYPDVTKVEAAFPNCRVMPLSRLTVDETGVKNGDVTSFSASLMLIWMDDPNGDFDPTETSFYQQYIDAHFIDIEKDVEEIGEMVIDVQLPYDRVLITYGEWFTSTSNHMVISLTEFSGMTAAGNRKEKEQTYSQTTTSGWNRWYWAGTSTDDMLSILQIDLVIKKFEYTRVEEVDPVDAWAIIGAIGGAWQFVVVAFGVFFIYSEKQPPDRKMRNFRDTVVTPAVTINRRLSGITSSRSSQQDVQVDATEEDLPTGSVKRQRQTGSVYYSNTNTGSTRLNPPHENYEFSESTAAATTASRSRHGLRSLFRGGQDIEVDATDENLPPGWVKRQRQSGSVYYYQVMTGSTRVTAPHETDELSESKCATAESRHQDGTRGMFRVAHKSPSSGPGDSQGATLETGGGGSLPPGWIQRKNGDGRPYYADTTNETTQWNRPSWLANSASGSGLQIVDLPTRPIRLSTSFLEAASPPIQPSAPTITTGDVVDEPLCQ